eukprot:gene42171-biopygen8443
MSPRDQQAQFRLLHDAWVEQYNQDPEGGTFIPFLREAGHDHYEVLRNIYNVWVAEYLRQPHSTCPRPRVEPDDSSTLSNNAKCFWNKIWSGQLSLGLGQPPAPNATFPIVPLTSGPCLQRKSNSWFRIRVPWGPQPFHPLVEDVSHKEPELPHMIIHHSYAISTRDKDRPWFPSVLPLNPYDYRTRMSYEELQDARRYIADHLPPSPRISVQSQEFRPYAFHSTSFLDEYSGPRIVAADIRSTSKSMPAHVLSDYWLPSQDERDDSPSSRHNSPAPRRVLLTRTGNLAAPQVPELVSSCPVPEPGTKSPDISPANAALFDMPLDSAGTPPVTTLPRLSEKLPPTVLAKFQALLEEFKQVFVRDFSARPWTSHLHEIRLEPGAQPRGRAPFRLPQAHLAVLQATLDKWLEEGIVTPSESPWAVPSFFVPKPDGSLRLVIDSRYLNSQTIPDRFPLPLLEDLLDRLHGAEIFSSFDAHSVFTQHAMHPNSRHLTAFITPMGLFQFTHLSMGLRNGPASFSRGMSFMSHDLPGMLVYLDDVNVYSTRDDDNLSDDA